MRGTCWSVTSVWHSKELRSGGFWFIIPMVRTPEIAGATIVLTGSFNPKIFQAEWLARQGLIPQSEADSYDLKIMAPPVTQFETERFVFQVTPDRFSIGTKQNTDPAPLRDLVQGTFLILEHTPATAMGLNFHMHFDLQSEEKWHQIGDKLAPKEGWKEVMEGRPGLASMTILTNRAEPKGSQFRVRVEPSVIIQHGVYFETNEHYPAPEKDPLRGLMSILGERWDEGRIYASKVVDHMLSWAAFSE